MAQHRFSARGRSLAACRSQRFFLFACHVGREIDRQPLQWLRRPVLPRSLRWPPRRLQFRRIGFDPRLDEPTNPAESFRSDCQSTSGLSKVPLSGKRTMGTPSSLTESRRAICSNGTGNSIAMSNDLSNPTLPEDVSCSRRSTFGNPTCRPR